MRTTTLVAMIAVIMTAGCGRVPTKPATTKSEDSKAATALTPEQQGYLKIAEHFGCLAEYNRGTELIQKLSALGPEARAKADFSAYRGQKVAILGGGPTSGGTNDLLTEGGCYLRVVNKPGKDLRPMSIWWGVLVRGDISQVFPEDRIIVIEVQEKDWVVLETG